MNLFIIGNGFDLAHGIKSKYWDFGEYLQNYYPGFYGKLMAAINNDQGIWSDFEGELPSCGLEMEALGYQMAQNILDEIDYGSMGDNGMGIWIKEQLDFIKQLPEVLRAWIESVDINKPQVYRPDLFQADDLYLSFNYTNTLEEVYKIPRENILHIHGDAANPMDVLIMGHGDEDEMDRVKQNYHDAKSQHYQYESAESNAAILEVVLQFLENTYKDTEKIIYKKRDFFNSLCDVDNVIVIGSSLSSVDYPYFKHIKKIGEFNWTIIYYDSSNVEVAHNEKAKAENFLKSLGIPESKYNTLASSKVLL